MATIVPTDAELTATADELGVDLAVPGARARVARAVQAAREQAEQDAAEAEADARRPAQELLSRTVHAAEGGRIVVDVHFIPNRTTEQGEPR